MIQSFRHKGLRDFYLDGNSRGLNAAHLGRITEILTSIHVAKDIESLNRPSFRLHKLRGDRAGFWSVTVRANWRIVFRFLEDGAHDVDLVDYH